MTGTKKKVQISEENGIVLPSYFTGINPVHMHVTNKYLMQAPPCRI